MVGESEQGNHIANNANSVDVEKYIRTIDPAKANGPLLLMWKYLRHKIVVNVYIIKTNRTSA